LSNVAANLGSNGGFYLLRALDGGEERVDGKRCQRKK